MKILYPLGMFAAALFSPFACYSSWFWGWAATTPLTDEQRARAQYNTNAWFAIFIACLVFFFVLLVFWTRSFRNPINETESAGKQP